MRIWLASLTAATVVLGISSARANTSLDNDGVRIPSAPNVVVPADEISKVLYLNRCVDGCVIRPGENSATLDTSSIPNEIAYISEWRHSDEKWDATVKCIQEIYAPYDIEITDVAPSNDLRHHEAIVAGYASEIGQTGIGGVSPFFCEPANNIISYTFANQYNSAYTICAVVAQESGHSFGLEHSLNCADPLTYLPACGRQFFRDVVAPCGEFEERDCDCGGTAQNSHNWMLTTLGPNSIPVPGPDLQVQLPKDGDTVDNNFAVSATATHMRGILEVVLYINGTKYSAIKGHAYNSTDDRYRFVTPDLADSILDIEVRAYNDIGTETIAELTVTKGAACTSAEQCSDWQDCLDGRCFYPSSAGTPGAECAIDQQCVSGTCTTEDDESYCTESCFPSMSTETCTDGFTCHAVTASEGYCWPSATDGGGGCGCRAGSAATGTPLLALFGLLALRRRRRR